jgi:hypothetical protein
MQKSLNLEGNFKTMCEIHIMGGLEIVRKNSDVFNVFKGQIGCPAENYCSC